MVQGGQAIGNERKGTMERNQISEVEREREQ
jgi:hypothetical protein